MRSSRVIWTALALAGAASLNLGGCIPTADPLPPPFSVADGLIAEYVMFGEPRPTALAATDDGRVFYTEKNTGRIRVIQNGQLLAGPFAEVPVNFAGDRGLLGIALHPRFVDNGRVYVFYTRSNTGLTTDDPNAVLDNRVVYFESQEDATTASGGEVFVASFPTGANATRIGGRLAFMPDRTLLVALGDLTSADLAQNDDALFGKVLRINDDGTVPADNPNPTSAIYARGFRNPRGLAIDPESGRAFLTEATGQNAYELDVLYANGNYGWPDVSGFAETEVELEFAAQTPSYIEPFIDTGILPVQLIGATFNEGTKYGPSERFKLFYGDETAARVLNVPLNSDRSAASGTGETFAGNLGGPVVDVLFVPWGTLYVARVDAILRIEVFTTD